MLKTILIITGICIVYEFLSNFCDMMYLYKTNYKINTNKQVLDRMIHVRNLCAKAHVLMDRHVFESPDRFEDVIHKYTFQAAGEYRHRVLQCLNPVYWVKCVLFLPQRIIGYFDFNVESIATKIFNSLYWVVNILVQLYSSEVKTFIDTIIKNVDFGG